MLIAGVAAASASPWLDFAILPAGDALRELLPAIFNSVVVSVLAVGIAVTIGAALGLWAGAWPNRSGLRLGMGLAFAGLLALAGWLLPDSDLWSSQLRLLGTLAGPATAVVILLLWRQLGRLQLVTAANRQLGGGRWLRLRRDWLPLLGPSMAAAGLWLAAASVLADVLLAVGGLGLPAPSASWGRLLADWQGERRLLAGAGLVGLVTVVAVLAKAVADAYRLRMEVTES